MRRASHGRRSPSVVSLVAVAACSATSSSLDAASGRAVSSFVHFSRFFTPSISSFSSRVFRIFDAFTPTFIIRSPGTPRLRHHPHTFQRHSTIFLAAYRLMSGSSPPLSSLSRRLRPRHPVPRTPATFFAPSALSCSVVRTSAEVEPCRHPRSRSCSWSSHLGSGRPASTPLVTSPLTGNGYGQVSPGAAFVCLREAPVSVDTPAFRAPPRFWSV